MSVLPVFKGPAVKSALRADLDVLVELLFDRTIVDEVGLHQLVELETGKKPSRLFELALEVVPALLGVG